MMNTSSFAISTWPRWKSPWVLILWASSLAGRKVRSRRSRARVPSSSCAAISPSASLRRPRSAESRSRTRAARFITSAIQTETSRSSSRAVRETRDIVPARERELHLREPLPDVHHQQLVGGELAALRRVLVRQQPLLLDEAVEIGAGDRPGLSLVLYEPVHDRDRAAPVLLDQLDGAEQRRRVLEIGDLGEKAPDCDFRIDAGLEAPKELHHQLAVDDRRAVRLLGVDRAHCATGRADVVREATGGAELQLSALGLDRVGGADLLQHRPDQLVLSRD